MWIVFQVLYWLFLTTGVVSSASLADYDLPGILSNEFCKDDILRARFEPICKCKDHHKVTDVKSLCREHAQFGHCVESHIQEDTWGFLKYTFSKKNFVTALNYICNQHLNSVDGISSCVTPTDANGCSAGLAGALKKADSITEEKACLNTEGMSRCLGNKLKYNKCSIQVQYFWSKLSKSYMGSTCTKYLDESRAIACFNMTKMFHPNRQGYTYLQCLDVVDMMRDCYVLERENSQHHVDRWYNKGFKLERFIQFERFRCRVQEERQKDLYCETNRRKKENDQCRKNHNDSFNKHINLIKNGSDVTIPEICRMYDRLTSCTQEAFAECPKANAEQQLAIYCGQMPVSCYCPIKLESSGATSVFRTRFVLTTIIVMLTVLSMA